MPCPAPKPSVRAARRAVRLAPPLAALLAVGLLIWRDTLPASADPWFSERLAHLRDRQAEHPGRPPVVFLGSSRTLTALRPAQLAAARPDLLPFSLARTGSGPVGNLLTLRRLLADGVRPTAAVVEVMPAFLTEEDVTPLLARHTAAEWLAAGLPCPRQVIADHLGDRLGRFRANARRPWATLPADPCDGYGGHLSPRKSATPAERAAILRDQAAFFADRLQRPAVSPVAEAALQATADLCRANGIALWLVLMPEGGDFRRLYGPRVRDRLLGWVRGFADRAGVPLLDASDWLGDGHLVDGHHALRAGAEAFTRRLGTELPPGCGPPFATGLARTTEGRP